MVTQKSMKHCQIKYILTCFTRYPHLTERDVAPVDYVWKTFEVPHIYNFRGLYTIKINGFDERSYAEESHHITVFKMPCKVPKVSGGYKDLIHLTH